jgi:ribonuclease P protein component
MDAQPDQTARGRLRFGADRRLRRRADFQRVYRSGRKAHGRFAAIFCLPREAPTAPWRLGLTATRKTGSAVRRNRQRRRVREFFRIRQARIPEGWDFVVNTKAAMNDATPEALSRDLTRTLLRLGIERKPEAEAPLAD